MFKFARPYFHFLILLKFVVFSQKTHPSEHAHGFLLDLFHEGYFTDLDLVSDVEYIRHVHIAYSVFLGALSKYHQYRSIESNDTSINDPEHLIQTWFKNIGLDKSSHSHEFYDFPEDFELTNIDDFYYYDQEYTFSKDLKSNHCSKRIISEECLEQPFIDDLSKKLEFGSEYPDIEIYLRNDGYHEKLKYPEILVARILGEDVVKELSQTRQSIYDLSKRKLGYSSYSRRRNRVTNTKSTRTVGLGSNEMFRRQYNVKHLRTAYKKLLCLKAKHSFC